MRLLLLNGSLRRDSVNGALLRTVLAVVPAGITAELYGGMGQLPHFNPDEDHAPLPPAVEALREAVARADAVLICTPEYAGALPGSFKNLLDWTVGSVVLDRKPVAWVNCSVNPAGAGDAHASLRLVLGYVGAQVIEEACTHLPVPRTRIEGDGLIHDGGLLDALRRTLAALRAGLPDASASVSR